MSKEKIKDNVNEKINVRRANTNDLHAITKLYSDTVKTINAADYSPEQIKVWSASAENTGRWFAAINEQYFVIAEINGAIAGFSSIAEDGYLDFMYVSKNYQRCGVASELLREIEKKATEQKITEIYSHVSKTAKGFFEKMGYEHKEDLRDVFKGVLFINALMVKNV